MSVTDHNGKYKPSDVEHKDVLFQIASVHTGSRAFPVAMMRQMTNGQVTQTSFLKRMTQDFEKNRVILETQNSVYTLEVVNYANAIEAKNEVR